MRANEPADPRKDYEAFILRQVRPVPAPHADVAAWDDHLRKVRERLHKALGLDLAKGCELSPEILGVIERDDYVVERLTFQSQPDVRVTANLYRPKRQDGPAPGVLCVHGHWPGARIDPVVQTRCIGLAKLGYVCLCVDAFGAGERTHFRFGIYHGGPSAAMLWAAGVPLIGLQVHDNRRAVDYLTSRPEVDASRLAITGASGGGNQTLYAGALDDRFKAVVPVCGIGTYEAYLKTGCCVCEVAPGALTFTRTGDVLAMIAPRALLVVSALQDSPQFSHAEAAKSIARARPRFEALGAGDRLRHVGIDSKHDYNQSMREAMYGWLDRWLRDKGDGSPTPEPRVVPEDMETLRCYPEGIPRPKSIVSIPDFTSRETAARLAALPKPPDHREAWEAEAIGLRAELAEILGGLPKAAPPRARTAFDAARQLWTIEMEPEPGLSLTGYLQFPDPTNKNTPSLAIMAREESLTPELAQEYSKSWTFGHSGTATLAVELRALGRHKPATHAVAKSLDHNEAEWGVWVGRPLLGQWVFDLLQWVQVVHEVLERLPDASRHRGKPITLDGRGVAGTAAMLAGGLSPDVDYVVAQDAPVEFTRGQVFNFTDVSMGLIAPNLFRVGDIGRLASLMAPRALHISSGLDVQRGILQPDDLSQVFDHATKIYELYGVRERLSF